MISLIFMFGFLCRYPDDLRSIVQQCANGDDNYDEDDDDDYDKV